MAVVRVILLLVILAGLIGLGLQNLSPAVPLVFLGLRSQPISLALLILGAIAAGIVTGLIVQGLVQLSNYLTQRSGRFSQDARRSESSANRMPFSSPAENSSNTQNDYQAENYDDPDPVDYSSQPKSYEAEPGPRSGYQSGSSYSYSYRDSRQSGVGRREAIYDAEYREVNTPNQPPKDEDFDDEDFDFDDDSPNTRR